MNKITYSWVSQEFNDETGELVSQDFYAGDEVRYENNLGDEVDPEKDMYSPFDMVQPTIPREEVINVFLEDKCCSELIATFSNEEIYMKCVPALERLAKESGKIITESVEPSLQ